jgi:hypothetical protein
LKKEAVTVNSMRPRHSSDGKSPASHRGHPSSIQVLVTWDPLWISGTGAGFLRILRFLLPILIPPTAPHTSSSGADATGQSVGDVPSGLSLTPNQQIKKIIINFLYIYIYIYIHKTAVRPSAGLLVRPTKNLATHKNYTHKTNHIREIRQRKLLILLWHAWVPVQFISSYFLLNKSIATVKMNYFLATVVTKYMLKVTKMATRKSKNLELST